MKVTYIITALLSVCFTLNAQVTREQLATEDYSHYLGNYCNYPDKAQPQTPAPKGYKPFYVSHYARHGSRYLISNNSYHHLIPLLEKAQKEGQLTVVGDTMLQRLRRGYAFCKGKSSKLSAQGGREHEHTANRMCKNFPEIFEGNSFVNAYSSPVDRSIKSMNHFCKEIGKLYPDASISQQSGSNWTFFTRPNHDSIAYTAAQKKVQEKAQQMQDSLKHEVNISSVLFKDPSFVTRNGEKHYRIAYEFYDIFKSTYSLPEMGLDFNVFTRDQLWNYFKLGNLNWIERCYLIPGEQPFYKRMYSALNFIISNADEVIKHNTHGANLCFNHDTYVMPLVYVLGIEGFNKYSADNWDELYKVYAVYQLVPMAANVQIVFFRKEGSKDILVKFLLQEKEVKIPVKTNIWPYYHWSDVRKYYKDYMNKINPIEYVKKGKYGKTDEKEINT